MRLLEADALKNYARKVLHKQNADNLALLKMFDGLIDNAPTVELAHFLTLKKDADIEKFKKAWAEFQEKPAALKTPEAET